MSEITLTFLKSLSRRMALQPLLNPFAGININRSRMTILLSARRLIRLSLCDTIDTDLRLYLIPDKYRQEVKDCYVQ